MGPHEYNDRLEQWRLLGRVACYVLALFVLGVRALPGPQPGRPMGCACAPHCHISAGPWCPDPGAEIGAIP